MNQERAQQVEHVDQHKINDKYKTILLIGRSGDGKSPLTGHLGGIGCSEPSCTVGTASCARLYISKKSKLNIIDTKGLDASKTDEENQVFMDEVRQKTVSYAATALNAIIIMWSPVNNGYSVLLKTITALQKSFENDVIKSCIFMIQGNWESVARLGDLDRAKIDDQIKEIEKQFSHVPQGKYETKPPAHELKKQLDGMMKKIESYQVEALKKQQKQQTEKKSQESQEKLPKLEKNKNKEEEKREERKDEEDKKEEEEKKKEEEIEINQPVQPVQPAQTVQPVQSVQSVQPIQPVQPSLQQERVARDSIMKPMAKSGLLLTVFGGATGMVAIAFEQSLILAAGTIGVTAGAALLTAAAATGVFNGLSWAVQRARGIRAN